MALLRWIHLGKLTPLVDLIGQMQGGAAMSKPAAVPQLPRPGEPPRATRRDAENHRS